MKRFISVSLAVVTGLAGESAAASNFRSVYTDTTACPVTEEGEDAFTRECVGPGGVKAVLQYVDGLFGVFYIPSARATPIERSDMLEVSATAPHPYGAKHEWRVRRGETKPCAAIVRAYTTKGERLVVTDLATGTRAGLAKLNAQATAFADKACSAYRDVQIPPVLARADAQPSTSDEVVGDQSIAQAALRGKAAFSDVYIQTGISGAIEKIENCYGKITAQASRSSLAICGAMDIVAANVDSQMTGSYPGLAQPFFNGTKPDDRIARGMVILQLDDVQKRSFEAELAEALGIAPSKSKSIPEPKKSVFNFSK